MKKILSIKQIIESIGDKYLQKKYPGRFVDDFDDFDKKYNSMKIDKENMDTVYEREDGWKLLKNPKSLKILDRSVRGIILLNGDFYVESFSKGTIHQDIIKILLDKGIIKDNPGKNWGRKLPEETGFITVQRYKDSKWIAIGESNKIIYDDEDWKKYVNHYDKVIAKAKDKNPQINFSNKLVGVKFQGLKNARQSRDTAENVLTENINLIKNYI